MADTDDLGEIAASLAASTRELNDAATKIADAIGSQANTSNITIQAGGLTSAAAVCISVSSVVVMILFACWVMWQVADSKAQQEAWISVWQQRISDTKDK